MSVVTQRSDANVAWAAMGTLVASPERVADGLNAGALWGVLDATGKSLCGIAGSVTLTLMPPLQADREGFPPERVRVVATRNREALVYPIGPPRQWLHRNRGHPRKLCLQHPSDDPSLLWDWDDGIDVLLTRVRLHLLSEELWRRTGQWPGVDLPHGEPPGGVLEPVSDPLLMEGMRRWAR
ncbi:MAG: hypothetical protein JNL54_08785 [Kineosporiaceae bacterium]|nr:hypothetical protein [Kineosporiaceae bacterium]